MKAAFVFLLGNSKSTNSENRRLGRLNSQTNRNSLISRSTSVDIAIGKTFDSKVLCGNLGADVNIRVQIAQSPKYSANWSRRLRQVLFSIRAGVTKNTKVQCTRMKLLTKPDILATWQKCIDSL